MLRQLTSAIYILFLIGLVIVPLIIIVSYSFTNEEWQLTFSNFQQIFKEPNYFKIFIRSIKVAFYTTFFCLILAYPIAYFIAKIPNSQHQNTWLILLIAPIWTNFVLRTYAWIKILGENGFINEILSYIGLHFHFLYNEKAVIFGMVYNLLPFMILPIYNALIKIDRSYIDASHDLGASSWITFYKIIFPLSLNGVKSGAFLVFIPSITLFAISDLLGGAKNMLFGNLINESFFFLRNWHLGCAIAMLLVFFFIIVWLITNYKQLFTKKPQQVFHDY